MISSVKQAANRRNAKRSTGPRTGRGKARSRRNAVKHGLSVPALDGLAAQEVRNLAARFAAEGFVAEALPLAQASHDLRRIREIRDGLVFVAMMPSSPEDRSTSIINLSRLERYERRARSRLVATLQSLARAGVTNVCT
jgi:hypothetical protein